MMGDGAIRSGAVMDGFYPSATGSSLGVRLDAEDTRCSNCGRCLGEEACLGANFDKGL